MAWKAIKQRCHNKKDANFKNYGARGITVCERWKNSFESFFKDMGPRPHGDFSIERVNNFGNYEPSNCIWATRMAQGSNKRNNRLLTKDGITLTISEWTRRLGVSRGKIDRRLNNGWPIEKALQC